MALEGSGGSGAPLTASGMDGVPFHPSFPPSFLPSSRSHLCRVCRSAARSNNIEARPLKEVRARMQQQQASRAHLASRWKFVTFLPFQSTILNGTLRRRCHDRHLPSNAHRQRRHAAACLLATRRHILFRRTADRLGGRRRRRRFNMFLSLLPLRRAFRIPGPPFPRCKSWLSTLSTYSWAVVSSGV